MNLASEDSFAKREERVMFNRYFGVLVIGLISWLPLSAAAQERERPYDSLQAGEDAYRLAEEQRRNAVAAQAEVNDYLRQRATWRPVYGENIIYYRSPYGNPYDSPPGYYSSGYGGFGSSIGYATPYSYSGYSYQSSRRGGLFGNSYSQEQIVISPSYSGSHYYQHNAPYGGVYRQGYIAGYVRDPSIPYVRQPIGQRQVQTGPNRWESHPVYADDPPALRETPVAEADAPAGPIVRPKIITPREY